MPSDPVAKLHAKLDSGTKKAPSRIESLRSEIQAAQTSGNGIVHAGVVARPMNQDVVARPHEQNISKITDQRRQEVAAKGTSVARLGKEIDGPSTTTSVGRLNEEPRMAMGDPETHGTSVARLGKDKGTSSQVGDLS